MPKIEQGARIYVPATVVETKDASNIVVEAFGSHFRVPQDVLDRGTVSEEAVRELVALEQEGKARVKELEGRIKALEERAAPASEEE